jgi:hypothetical protein
MVAAALGAGAGAAGAGAGLASRVSSTDSDLVKTASFARAVREWQKEQERAPMRVGAGQLGLSAADNRDFAGAYARRALELYPAIKDAVALLESIKEADLLSEAVATADLARLKQLLDLGLDPESVRPRSLLAMAMELELEDGREVVKLLLPARDDPNGWVSASGATLLMRALRHDVEIARLLLRAGASIEARDSQGATPLINACIYATDLNCIRLLLELGAAVGAVDHAGNTALHYATLRKSEPLVKLLLEAQADQRKPAGAGATPLSIAAQDNSLVIVALMQNARAPAGAGAGQQCAPQLPPPTSP